MDTANAAADSEMWGTESLQVLNKRVDVCAGAAATAETEACHLR